MPKGSYKDGILNSIVIPLEQGLRQPQRGFLQRPHSGNSIVIPLEQGLRE